MKIRVVLIGPIGAENYELASSGMLAEKTGSLDYIAVAAKQYGPEPRHVRRFRIVGRPSVMGIFRGRAVCRPAMALGRLRKGGKRGE
jgi:hypothetical protein